MKFKQMFRWNWQNGWLSLVILSGVLLLVDILLAVIMVTIEADGMNSSNDMSAAIMAFVMGIVMYAAALRWGGANGASRRTIYLSTVTFFTSFCFVLALVCNLLTLLFGFINGQLASLFNIIYRDTVSQSNGFLVFLQQLFWTFCINLCLMAAGYLVGGAFYRLGRYGKVILSVGLPVMLFGVLPLGFTLLPRDIMQAIGVWLGSVLEFVLRTPLHTALVLVAGALVTLAFGWLLTRRAPVKAVSTV